jgi:hypothetical protein
MIESPEPVRQTQLSGGAVLVEFLAEGASVYLGGLSLLYICKGALDVQGRIVNHSPIEISLRVPCDSSMCRLGCPPAAACTLRGFSVPAVPQLNDDVNAALCRCGAALAVALLLPYPVPLAALPRELAAAFPVTSERGFDLTTESNPAGTAFRIAADRAADLLCAQAHAHALLCIDPMANPPPFGPVATAVGPKGSGKSTVLRLIINRLLTRLPSVAVLDLDCGQGEFMPPGILGLSLLNAARTPPITAPPFAAALPHTASRCIRAIAYAANSPRPDPAMKLKDVRALVALCLTSAGHLPPGTPILVNNDGWTSGIGADILERTFEVLPPTCVLEMGADGPTIEAFGQAGISAQVPQPSCTKTITEKQIRNLRRAAACLASPQSLALPIVPVPAPGRAHGANRPYSDVGRLGAAAKRLLVISQHLSGIIAWPTDAFLSVSDSSPAFRCLGDVMTSIPPVSVPLHAVTVSSPHAVLPATEEAYSAALQLAVVGLCTDSMRTCVGLGLARGVTAQKRVHILTQVPLSVLKSVTHLVLFDFPVPNELVAIPNIAAPFVAYSAGTAGSSVMLGRQDLKR